MADKSFGVKELNLLNASGTPTVTSPNNLNLNANTVAISTSCTIGNNLTVTSTTNSANLNVTGIGTLTRAFATDLSVSGVTTITVPANANPHSSWDVVNNSSSAYRFTGPGQDGAEDNPNIYLVRGQRYVFKMNASGHPFQIRVANAGAAYSDGVTNNGSQTGNVVFNVQHDAPAQLYYQCTSHGSMVGNIYIVGGPQVISGVVTATTFVGNLTGNPTGSGANLTNLPAANLTGTLPAISGANLTSLPTQLTLSNNADNRVITGGSGVNLNGEANFTYNGTTLFFSGSNFSQTGSGNVYHYLNTGNNSGDNSQIAFGDSADADVGYINYDHGTNALQIRTNGGSNSLTIDSSGNVEVTNKLTFAGDGHTRGIELGADADLVLYHDNNDAYFDNNKGDFYIRNDGNSTSEVLRLQAKGGEQSITCTPNGNVSLYYDNSRKLFTTSGGVTVESTGNTPKVQFRGASNLDMGKIDVDQFATNYSMMRFFSLANGTVTEWMRLLDNGNFCVGGMVGSSNNGNIQSPGQGNGNTNVGSAMWTEGRFICNSASTFSSFGRNSTGTVISFTRQGGDQGSIGVAVGSVSFNTSSDYRLKENVVSITDGITRVKQLLPKRFNFIEDTTNTLRDGFLAHEVSSIVPESITGTKDEVDSDNNPVHQSIDQSKLVPLLTAALQEAIVEIETLKTKVAALEGS